MSTVVLSAPNVTMANEAIHVIVEKTFISYKKEGWNGRVFVRGAEGDRLGAATTKVSAIN